MLTSGFAAESALHSSTTRHDDHVRIANVAAYIRCCLLSFVYKQVSDGTLYARINRPAGVVSFMKVRTH
jgi:hypothetical protein